MIYIVDDDQYVRRGLGILLKSAGLETELMESAEDFLNKYKPVENDMLILDMHMRGMDGCELLKYLNENEMYIPLIIITAYDELSSRECAKKYGAVAYLRKPIDGEALIDLIKYTISYV